MKFRIKATHLLIISILLSSTTAAGGNRDNFHNRVEIKTDNVTYLNVKGKKIETLIDKLQQEEYYKNKDREEDKGKKRDPDSGENYFAWFFATHKQQILNGLLAILGLLLIILISYRVYSIKEDIKEQKTEIDNYAHQLERIIEGTDRLVFSTWQDQKECIKFIDNVAFKKRADKDLSKVQKIKLEIQKVEEDIKRKQQEINSLRDKEIYYIDEISKLEEEFAKGKIHILDEGAALGFADTVLREFK